MIQIKKHKTENTEFDRHWVPPYQHLDLSLGSWDQFLLLHTHSLPWASLSQENMYILLSFLQG